MCIRDRYQCRAGDDEPRRCAVESYGAEWEILKVRSVLTRGLETKAPKLARDVLGALVVARLTDSPPHHRVVGKLVQARAQIVRRDRGNGGLGRPGARALVRPHGFLSAGLRGNGRGGANAKVQKNGNACHVELQIDEYRRIIREGVAKASQSCAALSVILTEM